MDIFQRLAVALAVGLLIGIERGWHERGAGEGHRIAGLRTFGLIGLLGALWALLAAEMGELVLGLAFTAFAVLVVAAHVLDAYSDRDYGITTAVAALVTFALGALAARGHLTIAGASAVVVATLLGLKPMLHSWLEQMEQRELYAIFKMLLISVVLLPILPDKGYGPWQALNPYEIWLLVVLIAGISFAGYFAVKLAGSQRGIVITGLFGGLASSTAVTLSFAKLGRQNLTAQSLLAAGVILAAGTMFPRMLLEVSVVNRELLSSLSAPLLGMMMVSYLAVPLLLFSIDREHQMHAVTIKNPFELLPALKFGLLLVVVMLAAKWFQQWFGDAGLYAVAAISGISDVDAITLSVARLARSELDQTVAVQAFVIAACVNTIVKGLMVGFICRSTMSWQVMTTFILTVITGTAITLLTV
jgi:uncharacterized membrane protein (DUF4010 family)